MIYMYIYDIYPAFGPTSIQIKPADLYVYSSAKSPQDSGATAPWITRLMAGVDF